MNKRKTIVYGTLTLLISTVVAILLAEGVSQVQYLSKLRYWGEFVPDKELAWIPRPNATFDVQWYP